MVKAGDSPTNVQWLLYQQDHGCCCNPLVQAGVTPGYSICTVMVVRWSGKFPLWFSYAIHFSWSWNQTLARRGRGGSGKLEYTMIEGTQSKTEGLEKVYPLAYSFSPLVDLVHPYKYIEGNLMRLKNTQLERLNLAIELAYTYPIEKSAIISKSQSY